MNRLTGIKPACKNNVTPYKSLEILEDPSFVQQAYERERERETPFLWFL